MAATVVMVVGVLLVGIRVVEGLVSGILVGVQVTEELIYRSATEEAEAGGDRA